MFWRKRIHWRLSTILNTSNKSVWSNVFWYIKVCILWKCIQWTIRWDKTQILKIFPSDKINGTKNSFFFFRELQLTTFLLLIYDSYMSWSTWFVCLKLCVGFSIFNSVFLQQNAWTLRLWDAINSFQNWYNHDSMI